MIEASVSLKYIFYKFIFWYNMIIPLFAALGVCVPENFAV